MRLKVIVAGIAAATVLGAMATPAGAQDSRGISSRGHTVFTNRDESGRARTRIIIQKRSYLDPGTEVLPGTEHNHDYAVMPGESAMSVLDNTPFGGNQSALPGPFTLESKNNPWLKF